MNSAERVLAEVLTEIAIRKLPDDAVPAVLLTGLNNRGWTLTNWNDLRENESLGVQFVRVERRQA